jgi:dTDP-4-amino-4,6-dideoxygalactose transaminase
MILFLDADWRDYVEATSSCVRCGTNRTKVTDDIKSLWVHENNRNSVLPCLSVRSGLDLYLKVMNFPPGSEVIMSAINIPDMVTVVKHHNLKVCHIMLGVNPCGLNH